MRPRIYFINRFFFPDQSATAQILTDLAVHLAEKNWDVNIITSRTSFTDKSVWLDNRETWRGIKITRVTTTRFGRATIFGRLFDYLSFYVSSFFAALTLLKKGDCVVAKTDPPMLSVPIGVAARLKRSIHVNWLQDLFPEVAERAGVSLARGPTGRILKWLRNRSLKTAKMNIAIGEAMRDKILLEGVSVKSVQVIPNFCDDETLVADDLGAHTLRSSWGFSDMDFVVEYSGNLGRAHDVETILGAAKILENHSEVKFLFIGGGHQRDALSEKAETLGLTSLHFQPYQDRSMLGSSLGVGDIHWMSLQPDMEGLIVPSKYYGVAAVGKPVLMIGDPEGEIGMIVQNHECGLVFAPGECQKVADALLKLSSDPARLVSMGAAARQYIDLYGARRLAMSRWNGLFESLLEPNEDA